jgi:chitin disaccharide deacetylase
MQSGDSMKLKGKAITAPLGDLSESTGLKTPVCYGPTGESDRRSADTPCVGVLIVNADDWGRDYENTERALECIGRGTVSSVSAMVFMKDSERAAAIACEQGIDAGLHLNFTTMFSEPGTPARLIAHQERVSRYLGRHRFAQVVFHPGLASSFEYLVAAQRNEFCRLYGREPTRLDGHHHMHLCSNVLLGGLLPSGTQVRRNFSFQLGEKSFGNRLYRHVVDRILARRHRLVDFFFSLPPLDRPGRLQRIFSLAKEFTIELETHPVCQEEYSFLIGEEIRGLTANSRIAPSSAASRCRTPRPD